MAKLLHLKLSNINEVGTLADCTIRRKKLLVFKGKYNITFLIHALKRIQKNKNNLTYVYFVPYLHNKELNLIVFEQANKRNKGTVVSPIDHTGTQ